MKIKLSLRLYFLVAVCFLGVCMAAAFSASTVHYHLKGMDSAMSLMMVNAASIEGVTDGHSEEVLGFYVASRWQDLPENIQTTFGSPPEKPFIIQKSLLGGSLFSPPEKGYFVAKTVGSMGQSRYVAKVIDRSMGMGVAKRGQRQMIWIAGFGVLSIIIFLLLVMFIIRTVAAPVEALMHWAGSLSENGLKISPPNFRYHELNALAKLVHNSLNAVQTSLEREHDFLCYASHELRTPIAVIRTNAELLEKVNEREQATDKQRAIVHRIERAGLTMSHLTETLLWLSRDDDVSPPVSTIQLNEMVEGLIADLSYLLQGKSVEIKQETAPYSIDVSEGASRIVLTNLIRNAFQYTQSGVIDISQQHNKVVIKNLNTENEEDASDETRSKALGFGLGLKLTKKLIRRFNWQYRSEDENQWHIVEVIFADSDH